MLETTVQIDPATHAECLEFIRAAIASNDRQTALDIKNVLTDVCQRGYVDRAAIWAALSDAEQQQFQELLGPPPIAIKISADPEIEKYLKVARTAIFQGSRDWARHLAKTLKAKPKLKEAVKMRLSDSENMALQALVWAAKDSIAQSAKPEIAAPIAPADGDGSDIECGF